MLKKISFLFVIIFFITVIIIKFAIVTIPVGYVGVRLNEFGVLGEKGVTKEDFAPGWHLRIPMIHSWHKFNSTVQTLELTRNPFYGSARGRDDVRVKSSDGYEVSIDVTLKYRIAKNCAHLLYQNTGIDGVYKQIVRDKTQKECQLILGQMKTEDFYNPDMRRMKAEEVKKALSKTLTQNYVEVIDVLLKDVRFDPQYEQKIQAKKLADQEVLLNVSLEKAEKMRGITRKIEKETEMKVVVIKSQLEAEKVAIQNSLKIEVAEIMAEANRIATELRADAELYRTEKEAAGELLVKTAEAEGEKLRNKAMQGVGGSTIVALEAARNLNISDITISSIDTDLLDLNKMAEKLGAGKK